MICNSGIRFHTCFEWDMLSSSPDNVLLSTAQAFSEMCVKPYKRLSWRSQLLLSTSWLKFRPSREPPAVDGCMQWGRGLLFFFPSLVSTLDPCPDPLWESSQLLRQSGIMQLTQANAVAQGCGEQREWESVCELSMCFMCFIGVVQRHYIINCMHRSAIMSRY